MAENRRHHLVQNFVMENEKEYYLRPRAEFSLQTAFFLCSRAESSEYSEYSTSRTIPSSTGSKRLTSSDFSAELRPPNPSFSKLRLNSEA